MIDAPRSPYEAVLGDGIAGLHPRLRDYFASIPAGSVGIGTGVFDTVGTPRRWLRPLLHLLEPEGIAFAVWQRAVPFTVQNRPVQDATGNVAVAAHRDFAFAQTANPPAGRNRPAAPLPTATLRPPAPDRAPTGTRRMSDLIAATPAGLVDYLGPNRRLEAHLAADVVDGELHLVSTRLVVRLGRRRLSRRPGHRPGAPDRSRLGLIVPAALAPRVTLVERFDDAFERQHVSVRIDLPLIGRVYEYAGSFTYEIVPEPQRTGSSRP